jgi:hypothetical protein
MPGMEDHSLTIDLTINTISASGNNLSAAFTFEATMKFIDQLVSQDFDLIQLIFDEIFHGVPAFGK